jgi:hypothetical protein
MVSQAEEKRYYKPEEYLQLDIYNVETEEIVLWTN